MFEGLKEAADEEHLTAERKKVAKWLHEFRRYIEINQAFIPISGVRYQAGEPSSSAPAESTVNHVAGTRMRVKRLVKQQQMRWTQRGAHLLLRIRTLVLDDQWSTTFRQWYPGLPAAVGSIIAA